MTKTANISLLECRYFERVSANRLEKIFADSAPVLFPLINVLRICIWQFGCSSDPFVSLSALVVELFFCFPWETCHVTATIEESETFVLLFLCM